MAVADEIVAVLPEGRAISAHWYVRALPPESLEPLPLRTTLLPAETVRFIPADATGGVLTVLTVMVEATLFTVPSLTMS